MLLVKLCGYSFLILTWVIFFNGAYAVAGIPGTIGMGIFCLYWNTRSQEQKTAWRTK